MRLRIIAVLVCSIFGLLVVPAGQTPALPHELFGFLLEQGPAVFDKALGKPFNTGKTPEGQPYRGYMIPGTKTTYLIVVFVSDSAVRLELTGRDYTGPTGFFELKLGQGASEVESILGKPGEIRHESDENVDLWDYKTANYSSEFDTDKKLYSIQVEEGQRRKQTGLAGAPDVRKFAVAVKATDLEVLMQMSSGSLVCTDHTEFVFERAARTDFGDRQGKLMSCLRKAAGIIETFGPDMKGADDQLRLAPEVHKVLPVTKFPAGCPLKEVVFNWEVGGWRVYEVTFR